MQSIAIGFTKTLFGGSRDIYAEIVDGVLELKLYTKQLYPRVVDRVLYTKPAKQISGLKAISNAGTVYYHLAVELSDGTVDEIHECKMLYPKIDELVQMLSSPDYIETESFALEDETGSLDIEIFQKKLIFSFPVDSSVSFIGKISEDEEDELFILEAPLDDTVGIEYELVSTKRETYTVVRKKIRPGAIALFAPLPLVAMAIPYKKVVDTSEYEDQVHILKMSGKSWQIMAKITSSDDGVTLSIFRKNIARLVKKLSKKRKQI